MKKTIVGGVYINVSEDFQRGPLSGLSRTLKAGQHDAGVVEKIIVSSQGRNPDNPSDRTTGAYLEQRLEPNTDGCSNCLTTVQKDNMVMEKEKVEYGGYRIRRLTERECWRLMDFTDEDFERAAEVNSKSQLYKQAGNAIVKNVLVAIFGQMIPGKENFYKE